MKISQYLYVFNYICTKGLKTEGVFYHEEIFAWHEKDGYTCYIGYKDLVLTLHFHGNNSFTYQNKNTLEEFSEVIKGCLPESILSER